MKIRCRIEPIPAPMTKAKIVASVGVREEIAFWSLGVSDLRAEREGEE